MRRLGALLLLGALALPACGAARADAPADDDGPLVVVLFDVSQSTRDVRGGYLDAFERVLASVRSREGRLVADVIDENPLAHSSFPIDVAFDGCSAFTENPLVCDAEASTLVGEAVATAESIVEGHPDQAGTDILGGLALAERVFASYPDARDRALVVLSDMVARSPQLTLTRGFAEADVEPTVADLSADGLVPDLDGVEVYVVGAGVVSGQELPGVSFVSIQRFWERLVEAGGGSLPPERYGAALVRFP